MKEVHGAFYLVVGVFVVIFSGILKYKTGKLGFLFFVLIGVAFILIGIIRTAIRLKAPKHVEHQNRFVKFCHLCGTAMEHFQEFCHKCGQRARAR